MSRSGSARRSLLLLSVLVLSACVPGSVSGDGDHGAGASGASTGGSGAGAAPGTGGSGGSGGAGCQPTACYEGPPGTEGVGVCAAGVRSCRADGTLGACEGAILPAADDCTSPQDEDCDGAALACTGNEIWSLSYGGANEGDEARAVDIDDAGNVIVGGTFNGSVAIGGAPLTSASGAMLVALLDPTGAPRWVKSLGTSGAVKVAATPDGRFVAAGTFGGTIDLGGGVTATSSDGLDAFVAVFDQAGQTTWANVYGSASTYESIDDVAVAANGDVVVAGQLEAPVDFGGGPLPVASGFATFVARLDGQSGGHVMSRSFGAEWEAYGAAVAVGDDDSVAVAGTHFAPVDVGCGEHAAWYHAGVYLARLDASGACTWSHSYGDALAWVNGLEVSPDGAIVVGGSFNSAGWPFDFGSGPIYSAGNYDGFLARVGADGVTEWSKGIGAPSHQEVFDAAVDAFGAVIVTGRFYNVVDFGGGPVTANVADAFVVKYDTDGGFLWARAFGGGGVQDAYGIGANGGGRIACSGRFWDSIQFDGAPKVSAGGADGFVVVLDP